MRHTKRAETGIPDAREKKMRTTHPRCKYVAHAGPPGDVEDLFNGASGRAILKSTVAAAVEDASSLDSFSSFPALLWP